MEESHLSSVIRCKHCDMTFSRKFNFKRHLKKMHNEELIDTNTKKCFIICVICSNENVFKSFSIQRNYHNHLEKDHKLPIKERNITFKNKEEFEAWRHMDRRDVYYPFQTNCIQKTCKILYYSCNRSNGRGWTAEEFQNMKKAGRSKKMLGTCTSRIIATFLENGFVTVKFTETHVGHVGYDVRSQRLSKADQEYLLKQLLDGVSVDQIIKNARNFKHKDAKPTKLNLITKSDLYNLARRKNIMKVYRQLSDASGKKELETVTTDEEYESSRTSNESQEVYNDEIGNVIKKEEDVDSRMNFESVFLIEESNMSQTNDEKELKIKQEDDVERMICESNFLIQSNNVSEAVDNEIKKEKDVESGINFETIFLTDISNMSQAVDKHEKELMVKKEEDIESRIICD